VTRAPVDLGWFRIHQVLNRVALIPAAIGFATLVASGGCRCFDGDRRFRHYVGYATVLGFMFCFCVVIGNKNELAFALFSGGLFYLFNSIRPQIWRFAMVGVVMLACIGFIDFARGFSPDDVADNVSVGEVAYSLTRLANSNEAFAAHMSLYGVLSFDLPLTYGSSIYSFAASVVPRIFWPDRPDDIYVYYANGVSAIEGQGYTVHHAAGWYLNFGVPGIILGSVLLGRIWAALYNNIASGVTRRDNSAWRIFCIIAFFTFSANLPNLIRCGPEGYKSILVDSFFVPVAILTFSRSRARGRLQTRATGASRIHRSLLAPAARPRAMPRQA